MMKTKNSLLMFAAAAALIAGAGVASAQTPPAPAAQQSAPTEKTMEPKGVSKSNTPDVKPSGIHSETKSPAKMGSETQVEPQKKTDMKGPEKTGDAKTGDKTGAMDQNAAGGSIKLSTEQHTTMRAAIKQHDAQPITDVNFSTSIGSRVPSFVHFYPVPDEMVHFYPRWRGYDYFLVGDEIIVVNPRTHEVVAILDA
jgi:hypothetical protein